MAVRMSDDDQPLHWIDSVRLGHRIFIDLEAVLRLLDKYYDTRRPSTDYTLNCCGTVYKVKQLEAYFHGPEPPVSKYFKRLHNALIDRDKKVMLANVKKLYNYRSE